MNLIDATKITSKQSKNIKKSSSKSCNNSNLLNKSIDFYKTFKTINNDAENIYDEKEVNKRMSITNLIQNQQINALKPVKQDFNQNLSTHAI